MFFFQTYRIGLRRNKKSRERMFGTMFVAIIQTHLMKYIKLLSVTLLLFIISSCATVRVKTDFDSSTDFSKVKTFAFYKKGIDKAKISDIDKRSILRSIKSELIGKGMTLSKNPDILVSIYAKSKKQMDIYYANQWHPHYYGSHWDTHVSKYTEGTLLIDFIDAKTKTLLWQGVGKGALITSGVVEKKEARINEFVYEILHAYPPISKK